MATINSLRCKAMLVTQSVVIIRRRSFIAALFAASVVVSGIVPAADQSVADSHLILGNEHYSAGRFDQAATEFSQAITLNQRFVNAYYNRGISYKRAGKYELAIADFTKAISLDAEDVSLYLGRRGRMFCRNIMIAQSQIMKRQYAFSQEILIITSNDPVCGLNKINLTQLLQIIQR